MEFKTPWILALLPFLALLLVYLYRRRKSTSFKFSSLEVLRGVTATWRTQFGFIPFGLRLLAALLVCFALAGPRKVLEESKVIIEGVDIVLALDSSGSMATEDFVVDGQRVNRFETIKRVVGEFIKQRKGDQLGLVTFAGRAYTVCPLTTDSAWLLANLERMRLGMIEDGTAIGSGIATSLSRFKNSEAKSKVIVLLTDGANNAGSMDLLTAAKTAAAMGIKIYTIGAGTKGPAPYPVQDIFGRKMYQMVQSDLDEAVLTKIAEISNGQFFRATNTEALRDIYKLIDSLEKSKIEQVGYKQYQELFGIFVTIALLFLVLEIILINTLFLKIP